MKYLLKRQIPRLEQKLICGNCGKTLEQRDLGKTWIRCHFCNICICHSCVHYMGIYLHELNFGVYATVITVCGKCHIKK